MEHEPEEWREMLLTELAARRSDIAKHMRYFDGDHDLPVLQETIKEQQRLSGRWAEFMKLMKLARANFMETVVEAVAERATVSGFRFGDPTAAREDSAANTNKAWQVWQSNKLDTKSSLIIRDALVCGSSYALVWPSTKLDPKVRVTNEHALQCLVEYDPETQERSAGIKTWTVGDVDFATLYLPAEVYKWSRDRSSGTADATWVERDVPGEEWPLTNPMGVVPLIEFSPRPSTLSVPRSEIDGLIDTQDRINATVFGRVLAAWSNGIRQRYVSGLEIEFDEDGEAKSPFESMIDSFLYSTDPNTKWGEFAAVDLKPFIDACQADIMTLEIQSKTPYTVLVSGGNVPNGESYKANTSGLVKKVKERCKHLGESFEETIRVALLAIDDNAADDQQTEVEWENPEYRTEGELVDALVKMATLGVPREVLWQRWGASPQEVQAWKAMALQDSFTQPGTPPSVSNAGAV